MDAFHRLSQLSSTVKERASSGWKSAMVHARGWQWLMPGRRIVFWGIGIVVALFVALVIEGGAAWHWYAAESVSQSGAIDHPHAALINPIGAGVVSVATAIGALFLVRVALQQAQTARERHREQTNADRDRRITESFSKATEQLGSDKIEVRVGGIYTLERISRESPDDYWTVMETLTAFVRERSQRNERERTAVGLEERISKRAYFLWEENNRPQGANFRQRAEELEKLGEPPATDIAAVLTVIKRRSEPSRKRENANPGLDFRGAVLKRADLRDTHLEEATLVGARLERANLGGAHLEGAFLWGAHLEGAFLWGAHLERASLRDAHLDGANLTGAHLTGADLTGADLTRADLTRAKFGPSDVIIQNAISPNATNLTRANLSGAKVSQSQLDEACGVEAKLPPGLTLKPCPEP